MVMSVRGGVLRGARGECNHMDEARLHPIPTVYFQVEKEDSPSIFFRVHIMTMMKVDRIFCGGDDDLEVLRNFSLVCLKESASILGIIAPRSEELCGYLAVMVADDFSDKAELSFGYLISE